MQDYEYAGLQRQLAFRAARRVLAPDAIPVEAMRRAGAARASSSVTRDSRRTTTWPTSSPTRRSSIELGIEPDRVLAVVRPPPETSAYHAPNALYERVLDRLAADPRTTAVVIPRTSAQADGVRARGEHSLRVPERAIDAQSLIAYADLVVSAGGTMNREAVALGTPVYTIFSGRMGAVDESLIAAGSMSRLDDPAELRLEPSATPIRAPVIRATPRSSLARCSRPPADVRRRSPGDDLRPVRVPGRGGSRLAAGPARRAVRRRIGAVDHPNERSLHTRSNSEAGGPGDLRRRRRRQRSCSCRGRSRPRRCSSARS